MPTLEKIKEPVSKELICYEEYLAGAIKSDDRLADDMLRYILGTRGKSIRPLIVLLSASMYGKTESLPVRSFVAAMLVEMVHTASLVHDDVIDESFMRRGKPSVNALWHSRKAVLIGDYILARSFFTGMDNHANDIVLYISKTMIELCEGELLQSHYSDSLEMTREIYAGIIHKKTASLLGTSAGVGVMSVGGEPEEVSRMKSFGDNLGMAFQIRDDILDYMKSADTGKPACNDLKNRKITLPLLTVLEKSTARERDRIISLLSDIRNSPSNAGILHAMVLENGGIDMASEVMKDYAGKAAELLRGCPDSACRQSLIDLCEYVMDRTA